MLAPFRQWDPVVGPRRFRRRPLGNRWQDWCNLVLAIWLFISPWVLQFGSGVNPTRPGANAPGGPIANVHTAAWNAWVLGALVFLVALSALSRLEAWQEWCNLIMGAWIFAAPWALGFVIAATGRAAWDHWVIGALIFLISLSNLSTVPQQPITTYDVGPPRNPL